MFSSVEKYFKDNNVFIKSLNNGEQLRLMSKSGKLFDYYPSTGVGKDPRNQEDWHFIPKYKEVLNYLLTL